MTFLKVSYPMGVFLRVSYPNARARCSVFYPNARVTPKGGNGERL